MTMTNITVRLPENMLHSIDIFAKDLHLSRSEYIKKAILSMNKTLQDKARTQQLIAASQKVRKESMNVNNEFGLIEHDPKD